MLTTTNIYPSFFTAEETKEIISELVDTIPYPNLPVCFGVNSKGPKQGTMELLPWTDLLLSIKQFIEDRLDIELEKAWLYPGHCINKFNFRVALDDQEASQSRSYAFICFGPLLLLFSSRPTSLPA